MRKLIGFAILAFAAWWIWTHYGAAISASIGAGAPAFAGDTTRAPQPSAGGNPFQRGTASGTRAGYEEGLGALGVHIYGKPTFTGFDGVPLGSGLRSLTGTGYFSYGDFVASNPLDASVANPGLTPESIAVVVKRK